MGLVEYLRGSAHMSDRSELVAVVTMKRLLAPFNAHDLDAIMSFLVDDCVFEMPRGPAPWERRMEGLDPVREGFAARFCRDP
jgi:hypothetical protein